MLEFLLKCILFDMEAFSISLLHFLLSLTLELGQLNSLVVAGDPVVLIGEDFSLMRG